MTKPKCKACHNKTYCASCSGEDAYALTVGSEEEPHKAKLLQEAPSRKRSIAALRTRCSQTSQPLEWGIHSSPTWFMGWPPNFNKAFGTSEQQYSYGWLQVTNCLSKKPASMAQCSHKERLHRYHEEVHSSSLPCSTCRPSQKAFKLAGHQRNCN